MYDATNRSGCVVQGALGRLGRGGEADETDLDAETVHLGEGHRDGVGLPGVLGDVVEHVRGRHRERFLRLLVAEQPLAHRGVELVGIDRETDHRVDDADPWSHAATIVSAP